MSTEKQVGGKKRGKTMKKRDSSIKIVTFKHLHQRHIYNNGTHYYFENVDVISDDPNLQGDLVKKYVNGKLVAQKFVSEDKVKELLKQYADKAKINVMGGAKKIAPAQNEPQQVVMQNNTSMGTIFKQSFAGGAGATLGVEAMASFLGAIFGSDDN